MKNYDPISLRNLPRYAHELEEQERKEIASKPRKVVDPKPSAQSLATLAAKFQNRRAK